jgi:hypothetical protein
MLQLDAAGSEMSAFSQILQARSPGGGETAVFLFTWLIRQMWGFLMPSSPQLDPVKHRFYGAWMASRSIDVALMG